MRAYLLHFLTLCFLSVISHAQIGSWNFDPQYRQHSEVLPALRLAQLNATCDTLSTVQQDTARCIVKRWLVSSGSLIDTARIPVSSGNLSRDGLTYSTTHTERTLLDLKYPIDTVFADVYATSDGHRIFSQKLEGYAVMYQSLSSAALYDSANSRLYAYINSSLHIPPTPNTYTDVESANLYSRGINDSMRVTKGIGSFVSWTYSSVFRSLMSTHSYATTYLYLDGGFQETRYNSGAAQYERTLTSTSSPSVPEATHDLPARCSYAAGDSLMIFSLPNVWYVGSRLRPDSLWRVPIPIVWRSYAVDPLHFVYLARDSAIVVAQLESMIPVDTIVAPVRVASLSCMSAESLLVVGEDQHFYLLPSRSSHTAIADFQTSKRVGYRGLRVTFVHSQPYRARTWRWDFGDGVVDSTSGPLCTHVYSDTGLFRCSLELVSTVGTRHSSTNNYSVLVVPDLSVDFDVDNTWGPAPLTIQCINRSRGTILSYLWNFDDNFSDTIRSPQHSFIAEKCHSFRLTIRDTLRSISLLKPCLVFPSYIPVRRLESNFAKRIVPSGFIENTSVADGVIARCEAFGRTGILSIYQMLSTYTKYYDPKHVLSYDDMRLSYYNFDTNYVYSGLFTGATSYTPPGYAGYSVGNNYSSLISVGDSLILTFKYYNSHEGYGDYASFGTDQKLNLPVQSSTTVGSMVHGRQLALLGYYANGDSTLFSLSDLFGTRTVRTMFLRGRALRVFDDLSGRYLCVCSRVDSARNVLLAHIDTAVKKVQYDTLHTSTRVNMRDMMRLANGNYLVSGSTESSPTKAYCAVLSSQGTILQEHIYDRWAAFSRITSLRSGGAYILCGKSPTMDDFAAYARVDDDGYAIEDARLSDTLTRVRDMCLARDQHLWIVGSQWYNGTFDKTSIRNAGFVLRIPSGQDVLESVSTSEDDVSSENVIFPQPAQDHITLPSLEINNGGDLDYSIYSTSAALVTRGSIHGTTRPLRIEFGSLPTGVYSIVIHDRYGSRLKSLVFCVFQP